ncbi:Glutamate/Leucine/Phenylalanine/Valine dehydrogenase-domain-containing protein [Amylostereum chailletii]|nr:Glutamate/Leucine/Phenylalanine/Valine dehydrogenase-domain-containing protein [Amylostereum chailletii]
MAEALVRRPSPFPTTHFPRIPHSTYTLSISTPTPDDGVLDAAVPTVPAFLSTADSRTPSDASLQRLKNVPGYTTPVFKGKEQQRAKVQNLIASKWFYAHLGIDDTYFRNESVEVISDHILALFGAKVLAYTKHDPSKLVIDLEKVDEAGGSGATFIHTSPPGLTSTEGPGSTCEARIDELYLDKSIPDNCYRLETFRSTAPSPPPLNSNSAVTSCPNARSPPRRLRPSRACRRTSARPTLSYQRLHTEQPLSDKELHDRIRRTVLNKQDLQVLESFLIFNKHVLKTNFYQPTKVALSFRLTPDFLPEVEYPNKPFGLFFVIGNDFRGFHIRFRDVARGGIRIVRSRNKENYSINQRMLASTGANAGDSFDENYGLASTQSLKNKDIPEGGAKGTILPSLGATPRLCFEKYVDSMLDLLIPGQSPGIKERLVDLYNKPEILFFGPDEGTADMMDWAARAYLVVIPPFSPCLILVALTVHARARGAETWWKSFTTGKTAETLGGVPHDTYGMTSLSVRQYVLGIYKQLGLREKDITKVQTGGPDGDLGSNEILLSSDKTVAVIDGSGVLADPAGINREELIRLAKLRVPASNFDTSKLSKDGYLVRVEDQDVKLPCASFLRLKVGERLADESAGMVVAGEVVMDGTDFRNGAHLRFKADLLVPCGGRPEAVNISNVAALVDAEGKPHFKYIVEGANLFFTQQARLYLEKRKVVLFKDSSANKGGVTSSSLEVLAGLALATDEYVDLMIFKNGQPSAFYQSYVRDIQAKITENAAAEFACIWREYQRCAGAKARTTISDELSGTLNRLQAELEGSDLFEDRPSREGVLRRAIPKTLVEKIGLEALTQRLPEPYQRALFSCWVASHFIYKYGVRGSSVDFFHFARDLAH